MFILLILILSRILIWVLCQRHVYYCPCCNAYYDGIGGVHIFSIGNDFAGNKKCRDCIKLNETIQKL